MDETTLRVTELPVRKWTQDYKELLEALIKPEDKNEVPLLLDYKEHHTDANVDFVLSLNPSKAAELLSGDVYGRLKLTTKFSCGAVVCLLGCFFKGCCRGLRLCGGVLRVVLCKCCVGVLRVFWGGVGVCICTVHVNAPIQIRTTRVLQKQHNSEKMCVLLPRQHGAV